MLFSDRHPEMARFARVSGGICGALMLLAVTSSAQASEGAAQLVASFQTLCMAQPLDFARSEQKAAAMQLSVQQALGAPADESGYYTRSKSWSVMAGVPHEFIVSDTHGPKGDFKSCGIRATEADAADFKGELVKAMKLGKPATEAVSADGMSKHTVWTLGDLTLTMSDKSPQTSKQGVRLLISNKPL
jgi:hypothetical protein